MPTGQVFMTYPHHDAARRHERRRREGEVLGPRSAATVTSRPVLSWPSVCRMTRPAQPVLDEDLLGLGEPELPGKTGVLYGGERRGASAAVVAGDRNGSAFAFATPAATVPTRPRRRASRSLWPGVGVLEVVDELRQVLYRVDVVVGRRRDQADAGRGVPYPGYVLADLVPGNWPPSPGLDPGPS